MHPSVRVLAHKPLISFIGKRVWPASAPFSPSSSCTSRMAKVFSEKAVPHSSPRAPLDHAVFLEFWDVPARFSKPSSRYLEQVEIDAILSGGASLR
ncbi:hypothetical protein EDB19DRAFT_1668544 [Suillus lakei]|nr:hypothetical protein EDB19DRAFT_1668544 [Suillus lakei]